jgi:hypothetical protein
MTYHIQVIGPGLVQIHEEEINYPMSRAQAEENIEKVKANRAEYADDEAYLRRLSFYEEVLNALGGNAK